MSATPTGRRVTAAPRPDPAAGSAMFETQLVRWAKVKLVEARAEAQRAAAAHYPSAYNRADARAEVLAELLDIIDPLGEKP